MWGRTPPCCRRTRSVANMCVSKLNEHPVVAVFSNWKFRVVRNSLCFSVDINVTGNNNCFSGVTLATVRDKSFKPPPSPFQSAVRVRSCCVTSKVSHSHVVCDGSDCFLSNLPAATTHCAPHPTWLPVFKRGKVNNDWLNWAVCAWSFTFRQWAVCDGGDNQAHVASLILCFSSSRDASDRFYDASGSPSLTSEFLWFSLEFVAFLVLCCGTAVDARFYRFIYKILFVFRVCGERCKGRNHSQPISLCALLYQFAVKSSMRHVARIDAPRRMNRCATSH